MGCVFGDYSRWLRRWTPHRACGRTLLLAGPLVLFAAFAGVLSSVAQADTPGGPPLANVNWSLGPAIPTAHQEAAGVVAMNKFFVISGGDVSCSDVGGATATNAVEIYDPVTNSFSSGPSVNIARDEYPLAARVRNSVFLIGGTAPCGATVRPTERLNLSTGKWSVLPSSSDLPPALDGAEHCGVAIGDNIYYFQAAGIGVFDAATRTWTVLPPDPLLNPSSFCQATRVGDTAVITGPGDGSADAFSQRILIFDAATNTITQSSSTTVALAEHTSGFLRGQVVVAGGDFSGEASVQGINVPLDAVTTFNALPTPSDDAVGGVIGNTYYILGGNNGTTNTPPVLIGTPTP